jgi:hypothetical protein
VKFEPHGNDIIKEFWLGLCPYLGGDNLWGPKVDWNQLLYDSLYYRSMDTGTDDNENGKRDSIVFNFSVAERTLSGKHYENNTVTQTRNWDDVAGGAIPDIPGNISDTLDKPLDLLVKGEFVSGGELDKELDQKKLSASDCPLILEGQTISYQGVPTLSEWALIALLLLIMVSGLAIVIWRRRQALLHSCGSTEGT